MQRSSPGYSVAPSEIITVGVCAVQVPNTYTLVASQGVSLTRAGQEEVEIAPHVYSFELHKCTAPASGAFQIIGEFDFGAEVIDEKRDRTDGDSGRMLAIAQS